MQINVLDYFENGALRLCRTPTAIREGNKECTFEELERAAKNCAALILKRTLGRNQPIPVFLPKGIQNVVADLGVLYSANAYANLDVKSPAQRLKGML
ncbi:MAG TPA: AMP-binding protein, partial [Verrucomicrobiae bacterium]|nr:AMP-binding protein [Verrucomicrobiae bacterium]